MSFNAAGLIYVCRAVLGWVTMLSAGPLLVGCGSGPSAPAAGPDTGTAGFQAPRDSPGTSISVAPDDSVTPAEIAADQRQNTGSPVLVLQATPPSVAAGGTSMLTWRAGGARACEASGGWSGARPVSGAETVGPIQADTAFRLSCSGDGGGVQHEIMVTTDADEPPMVTLVARPPQVARKGSARLFWAAPGATYCRADGGRWHGPRPVTGSFGTGPLVRSGSYTLSCTGPGGTSLASVNIDVLDRVLRWQAPNRNVDGSRIKDLAGYKIYWGTESRVYGPPHVIHRPSASKWHVDLPAGTYFFALTAFNKAGKESGYSNEVVKTIP